MGTRIVVPCRISYANIWSPASSMGGPERYSVSCLVPKSDKKTLTSIQAAIDEAKEDAKGKRWGGKIPGALKLPLHDGDEERPDDPVYEGMMYFNAISKDKPQIVDRHVQPILDPMECGSGDYCNISVTFYGFSNSGNRGIAVGLGNIQKLRDGERLSGRLAATADFKAVDDDDDFLA